MPSGREPPNGGIPTLITRLADGLGRLVTEHITLAKLELSEDARAVGGELAKIAVFLPFVLVGYGFLCAALALALAPFVGTAGALAIVGGVNALGGGLGLYRAAGRLRERRLLGGTMSELNQTTAVLAASASSAPPSRNSLKEIADGQ